jgi:glycosyltransferase involved in cell wall biosynthesis
MKPLVSVIIPTYNRVDYLKLALKSVLEQAYKNIEVIVTDDGSTDDTAKVVADFNDPRIKYFYQKNTSLPAATRNLGLREASGEYIAFLDDDDLWCPEKLEIQVEYLRKHLEYYLVYSNAWFIDENGVRDGLLEKLESFKGGKIFEELVRYNCIPQLTVLMKREVFEKIGFFNEDPTLRAIEDYEYWLRVALQYKIGFVKEPLAMYRVHSGGATHEINHAKQILKALSSVINDPSVPNKNKVVERIYELYLSSAIYNWKNSDRLAAREELKKHLMWSIRNFRIKNVFKVLAVYLVLKLGIFFK